MCVITIYTISRSYKKYFKNISERIFVKKTET